MRALALDIGETRVGVAVSDPQGRIATPVCVLPAAEVSSVARSFRRVLEDWEPEVLVCGRPLTMAGEEGPQAERVSAEAKRILREQGLSEKSMRGKVDMVAASLFLQAWLDARQA